MLISNNWSRINWQINPQPLVGITNENKASPPIFLLLTILSIQDNI